MGIFDRISTVIKSNLNDMISKAEDPEKMLNQMIIDMNEKYNKAKGEVAVAIAEEKKLKRSLEEQEGFMRNWAKKAELAVASGDDKLALAALNRKKEHTDLAEQYKVQWQGQNSATDQLKWSLKSLSNKIEEAKGKKSLLIARAKSVEAQKSIQNTLSGLNDTSVFDTFDRMSQRVDDIESRASAEVELNEMIAGDDLEKQFANLESSDDDVMDELAALKAKLEK